MGLAGGFTEVDLRKVYAADRIVAGRLTIDPAAGRIDGRSPLRSARDVRTLPCGMLDADGNVEIIEQVETLPYGFESGSTLRSRRLVKSRSYEARRRYGIARKAEEPGIAADRMQRDAAQPPGGNIAGHLRKQSRIRSIPLRNILSVIRHKKYDSSVNPVVTSFQCQICSGGIASHYENICRVKIILRQRSAPRYPRSAESEKRSDK